MVVLLLANYTHDPYVVFKFKEHDFMNKISALRYMHVMSGKVLSLQISK